MTAADLPVIEAWLRRARRDSLVMDGATAIALLAVTGLAVCAACAVLAAGFSSNPMRQLMGVFFLVVVVIAGALVVLCRRWLPAHWRGMQALRQLDIPATARVLVALWAAPASVPLSDLVRLVPGADFDAIAAALIGLAGVTPVAVPHEALVLPVEQRDALEAEIRRP